jgi:hypothetical protein
MDLLFLDDLIGQSQQLGIEFEQLGAGFLGPPPGGGQLAHAGALSRWHRIELVLARFGAGQNPGGVQLTLGAAAGGFSTFAAQEVKTAGDEVGRGGHEAQKPAGGAELAPELVTEGASGCVHMYLI